MTSSLIVTAALLLTAPFEAQLLDGTMVSGELVGLSATELRLQTPSGEQPIPLVQMLRLAPAGSPTVEAAKSPVLGELVDGSRLPLVEVTITAGKLRGKLLGGDSIECDVRQLRSVRLLEGSDSSAKLDAQWNEFASAPAAGDLLVVRAKGTLDSTEGVVGDLHADGVDFKIDGESIRVKRTKLEGIVLASPAPTALEPLCLLELSSGAGTLVAKSVELAEERWKVVTVAGVTLAVPLAKVRSLDFSAGKVAFLADLEPERQEFTSEIGLGELPAGLSALARVGRNRTLENEPLRLDGKTFTRGVALRSQTRVVYRLPGAFRKFSATLGIDDAWRDARGTAAVELRGDGKSLWSGTVSGGDAPQTLELPLEEVRKLEIAVGYGERIEPGEFVDFGEAKVTK